MRKIWVLDTTLRDGEQSPGVSLTSTEKVEIALQLQKLGVDRIETGFPATSPGEIVSMQKIAKQVTQATLVGFARSKEQDIDAVREALRGAEDACLHLFLATSPIHRQHKLRMDKAKVLETAAAAIRYGRKYFSKIEFSAEDASRTELDFICEVVDMAIRAGATVVNLPDTVGYASPDQFGEMFRIVKQQVPGIEKIQLSTHCHDDLGMATANTLAAIRNGVDQFEGTINGIGERAGNTPIEEVALALDTRTDLYGAQTSLILEELYATSRLVSKRTGMSVPGNKAIVGANAFAHESGIHQDGMLKERTTYEIVSPERIGLKTSKLVLGKHSGRHAFKEKLADMGFDVLTEEQLQDAFRKFKALADKKKQVLDEDLLVLMDESRNASPQIYTLNSIQVSYGNQSVPVASIRLNKQDGTSIDEVAMGNGSVDAIFNAIDKASGELVELEDYSIQSVTYGKDALGEVHAILRQGEYTALGRGTSTDILEASAKAYIDALNKLLGRKEVHAKSNITIS
ncbi:2-isopropylmalate synthase [Paenibacillus sp. EKM202P]|uniref:2-isopropylmalate synthase n=1 Tax=unclassified Paenibacillus TaxID=185978 RepID=UPI0013EAD1BE|nr:MULTISPECIES: 2-isopropylmalate synthase [unclassified Paenibacillus]KAF6565114.1 2-isopropylmalate synthase [Paenibacillus sp. EKM202P]KAF6568125.1 2-isopropylmalate synthase [Paenibacillus sp. EKM207P]